MDEEEYQRIVNGAAGALAHTENLSAWQKIQDAARSSQEAPRGFQEASQDRQEAACRPLLLESALRLNM